jgi:hypothetical protein
MRQRSENMLRYHNAADGIVDSSIGGYAVKRSSPWPLSSLAPLVNMTQHR